MILPLFTFRNTLLRSQLQSEYSGEYPEFPVFISFLRMILSLANREINLIFYLELVKYRLRGDVQDESVTVACVYKREESVR